jgi:hypothetical protein
MGETFCRREKYDGTDPGIAASGEYRRGMDHLMTRGRRFDNGNLLSHQCLRLRCSLGHFGCHWRPRRGAKKDIRNLLTAMHPLPRSLAGVEVSVGSARMASSVSI